MASLGFDIKIFDIYTPTPVVALKFLSAHCCGEIRRMGSKTITKWRQEMTLCTFVYVITIKQFFASIYYKKLSRTCFCYFQKLYSTFSKSRKITITPNIMHLFSYIAMRDCTKQGQPFKNKTQVVNACVNWMWQLGLKW